MVSPFQLPTAKKKGPPHFRFVESVRVRRVPAPVRVNRRYVVLGGFWFLVVVKCFLAHWAIIHWDMPFPSVWVWAPTVGAGALCTIVFLASDKEAPG